MADKNIKITVRDRRAIVEGSPVIICGNSGYTVTFAFDDEWNLTGARTARFVYFKDGKVQHEDKVFSGNVVAVPVLSDVAFVKVGVFAGDICTTTPARINCELSILCGSGAVHEPTPDVYNQIMALFNEMAEAGAFGATEAQAQQIAANQADIAALVSGSKKAAKATNAEQLGGRGASEYVSVADAIGGTKVSAGVAKDKNIDVLYFEFSDGTKRLLKWDEATKRLVFSSFDGSMWSGDDIAYAADLANKLDKSGGTVGNIDIVGDGISRVKVIDKTTGRTAGFEVTTQGRVFLWDYNSNKIILESSETGVNTFHGAATDAQYIKAVNSDEVNIKGLSGKEIMWLNIRNGDTDDSDAVPLKEYRFGDKILNGNSFIALDMEAGRGTVRTILHTGNVGTYAVPITGGIVGNANTSPLQVNNTTGVGGAVYVAYRVASQVYGLIGVAGSNTPVFQDTNGANHTLHHDGNSVKMAFTESDTTAPSDTTALWAHL